MILLLSACGGGSGGSGGSTASVSPDTGVAGSPSPPDHSGGAPVPEPQPEPQPEPEPRPEPEPEPTEPPAADGIIATASGDDGYAAANTLDGSLDADSRWSANGENQWIQFDLGETQNLKGVNIAFYQGNSRAQYFLLDIAAKEDDWDRVFAGKSRLSGEAFQHFGFMPRNVRYVRIKSNGGAEDNWTALLEFEPVVDNETAMPPMVDGTTYYVAPDGNDDHDGASAASPKRSIQSALDLAQPGDTVLLAPGHYLQNVNSVRSGTQAQPITIKGPSDAVVQGSGSGSRIVEIRHDYIRLLGFTMDGRVNSGSSESDYRDKLVYVQGTDYHRGPTGIVIRGMTFQNAGGECLRLRYFIRDADVGFNHFENCGVHDFEFGSGGKNGEAIYLGTSSTQWADGKNPSSDADVSTNNRIHHNTFNTQGNECVDIKEGSVDNVVEYNYCTGQLDPNSGGFDSRSDNNTFRYNKAVGNVGAGVRLGGHTVDGHFYGIGNHVYGNEFEDNENGTVKFQAPDQGDVCENVVEGAVGRDTNGTYKEGYDTAESCAF